MPVILHVAVSVAKTLKAMDVVPAIVKLLAPEGLSIVVFDGQPFMFQLFYPVSSCTR